MPLTRSIEGGPFPVNLYINSLNHTELACQNKNKTITIYLKTISHNKTFSQLQWQTSISSPVIMNIIYLHGNWYCVNCCKSYEFGYMKELLRFLIIKIFKSYFFNGIFCNIYGCSVNTFLWHHTIVRIVDYF